MKNNGALLVFVNAVLILLYSCSSLKKGEAEAYCECDQLLSAIKVMPKQSPVYTNWSNVDSIIVYGENLNPCKTTMFKGSVVTNGSNGPADVNHQYEITLIYKTLDIEPPSPARFLNDGPEGNPNGNSIHLLNLNKKYFRGEEDVSILMWRKNQRYSYLRLPQCEVRHVETGIY